MELLQPWIMPCFFIAFISDLKILQKGEVNIVTCISEKGNRDVRKQSDSCSTSQQGSSGAEKRTQVS